MNVKMFSLKRIILITLAVTLLAITFGYYRLEFDKISRIREAITKSEKELENKRQALHKQILEYRSDTRNTVFYGG